MADDTTPVSSDTPVTPDSSTQGLDPVVSIPPASQTPDAMAAKVVGTQPTVPIYDMSSGDPKLGTIAPEEVTDAVSSGQYSLLAGAPIPVIAPDGTHGTMDPSEAPQAFKNGYKYATPTDIQNAKYATPGQTFKAALEGAASAGTFGLSTAIEMGQGVKAEDILGRAEAHPIARAAGQVAGLLSGVGAAGALEAAGAGAAEAVGLGAPISTAAKIGSSAVKAAVENTLFQGGDEVSKMLAAGPNQLPNNAVETAAIDMGLSGLFGGALGAATGAVSPLWKATAGKKVGGVLKAISDKLGGVEGSAPSAVEDAIAKSGMDVTPDVRARLTADPGIQEMSKTLEQTDVNASGLEHQKNLNAARQQAGDVLASVFGKTADDVKPLSELSEYESGKTIGKTLAEEYKAKAAPVVEQYDKAINKYASLELPKEGPGSISDISDKIGRLASAEGWTASPSGDIMQQVGRIQRELPGLTNVKGLGDYIRAIGDNMQSDPLNGSMNRAGGILKGVLKGAEGDAIGAKIGLSEGQSALHAFKDARLEYAKQGALQDAIDSRLKIKGSVSGYGKRIADMAQTDGESLLRRLSGKGDADWLQFVSKNFPQTADAIRSYHADKILSTAKVGEDLLPTKALKSLNSLSPELRSFVTPVGSSEKIEAIGKIMDTLKDPNHNWSNTSRVAEKLTKYLPSSTMATISMLTGHNPVVSAITGILTGYLGKTVPDAARLALLKFLGSSQHVEAGGFKGMTSFIHSTIKGENLLSNGVKSLFKAGKEVLPAAAMPSDSDRRRLDKQLQSIQQDPTKLFGVGQDTGHYLPDHSAAISQVAATGANYLNELRPTPGNLSPLDRKIPPSPMQNAAYHRALDIAQQPLVVLDKIKNGTLIPQDMLTFKTLYPNLYNRMSAKITSEMVDNMNKGGVVPYTTRMGLSMFLGQPLDSTMTPTAIMAAQPQSPQQTPQTATQPRQGPKRSMNALNKLPETFKTKSQAAEEDQTSRA